VARWRLAVEGCTGWRYVVEEITAAGFEAHVAEPADTKNARGRKHRAKTDLWVPKTRPGVLSRRFARHDRTRSQCPLTATRSLKA
jgi:hypothetical protein